jgi:hypothetical protein
MNSIHPLQQTAAAMLVSEISLSLSAAAAAERGRSITGGRTGGEGISMNIELTCSDDGKYLQKLEVHALCFDPQSKAFSMPYCAGDDWFQVMRCAVAAVPTQLQFQWDRVAIHFERQADAAAFSSWLHEAEEKAQHGYRTMRG